MEQPQMSFREDQPKLTYRCPRCQYEAATGRGLMVNKDLAPLDGQYCDRCFARWVADTVPRMERFAKDDDGPA